MHKGEDEWNWDNSRYYYLYGGAISFAGNVTNCNISGVYMDNHIDVTEVEYIQIIILM